MVILFDELSLLHLRTRRLIVFIQVSLDGHLFDHLLINEALDVIENAGGRFRLAACELGQTVDAMSHAELEVCKQ